MKMDNFLKECGLNHAIDKFKQNSLELKNLNKLTSDEIKELLPNIGDRHTLKDAIKRMRVDDGPIRQKRTKKDNSGKIASESDHSSSRSENLGHIPRCRKRVNRLKSRGADETVGNLSSSDESVGPSSSCIKKVNRLKRNDDTKKEAIIKALRTDEAVTADLTEKANILFQTFETHSLFLVEKYRRSGFALIDFEQGKLNCPICSSQIVLQYRKNTNFNWMLDNYKRHLDKHVGVVQSPSECYVSCEVNSVLEVMLAVEESGLDGREVDDNDDEVDNGCVIDTVDENINDSVPVEFEKTSSTLMAKSSSYRKKTDAPRKNKTGQNESFMLHKHRLHIQHPTSKELSLINSQRILLMRNMRKYNQNNFTENDSKMEKSLSISYILKQICEEIADYKDNNGTDLLSQMHLPSEKDCPKYYEKVKKPIDLLTIESNIEKGQYELPGSFDEDIRRLFSNAVKFYGLGSPEGVAAQELLSFYTTRKENVYQHLLAIIGYSQVINSLESNKPNQLMMNVDQKDDILRCICGLFNNDKSTIQCTKCSVRQHTKCTGAEKNAQNYLCEQCDNRTVDKEIPLNEFSDEGYQYYLTLLRDDLQVRQNDTVYVLRDIPIMPSDSAFTVPDRKHTYKTIGEIKIEVECDIFRIKQLWKDNDGNRFVYGHHYYRPHETYHEPTRKFYKNEVVRVPLYEKLPINLIMGRCWVLNPATFCKGRPVGCEESHVYICEYRVDKAARIFTKISGQYPICTKSFAFEKFAQKMKISRDYAPHDIADATLLKSKKKKKKEESNALFHRIPTQSKEKEKLTILESDVKEGTTEMASLDKAVQPINLM